jgi:hypothetical protein
MKILPKVIKSDGFIMTQVMREDDLAIYRRIKQIGASTIEHFEVIVIRALPERETLGKIFPEREKYPASEDWRVYGWTCHTLEDAWNKISKIRAQREEKTLPQ